MKKIKRRRRKNVLSLVLFVLFFASSVALLFKYPPDGSLAIKTLTFPVLPLFIILFSSSIFFLVSFFLGRIHGVILFVFFILYALLSIMRLNSIFFVVLLIILLIVAELFIRKGDI